MIASIISWLVGGGIAKITKSLQEAYQMKLKAQNDADKLAADMMIEQLKGEMQSALQAAEIRKMTSGFWEMRLVTFIIALCFTGHLVAVSVDTIFKLGMMVPAFPHPFDEWQGAILLSFFGIYTIGRGIQTVATAIMRRK